MPRDDWGLNWKTWVPGYFECVYCGLDGTDGLLVAHQFTVDHIRPRSRGGNNDQENLAVACCACNQIKAGWDKGIYDQETFAAKPISEVLESARNYIQESYRTWNPDYEQMIREVKERKFAGDAVAPTL